MAAVTKQHEVSAVERRPRSTGWWLLLPVGVCLAVWLPGINADFGAGYRGYNAAQWALGVDAINRDGLLDTQFGAVRSADYTYGNHPPLLVLILWAFRSIFGSANWAIRLPAILAATASLGALWQLIRSVFPDMARWAMIGGLTIAASTPMFLVYGPMVDTWSFGFIFGIGVLVALTAVGPRSWHAVVFAACALCSWQGAVLVVLALPIAARRFGWWSRTVYGGAIGVGLTFAYSQWVGSSSAPDIGWPLDGASFTHLLDTFGWTLLLVPAAMLSRDRMVAGVAIAAPLAYGIVTSGHADLHPYWFLWWSAPIALGGAALIGRLARAVQPEVVYAIAAVPVIAALLFPGPLQRSESSAPDRAAEIITAVRQSGQTSVPAGDYRAPWLEHGTGIPLVRSDLTEIPAGTYVVTEDGVVMLAENVGGG